MKKTLYELVSGILNDMDADEVDTIADTFESEQVAIIVRDSYFALIDSRNWPHLKQFTTLTESDATTPTHLTVPETAKEVIQITYNVAKVGETRRKYKVMTYIYPDEFLAKVNKRNNDEANIDLITDPSGVELLIKNDKAPEYYTSFDEETLVFDSYDVAVETYLAQAKFQVHAVITPTWVHEDAAVPDLPEEAFTLLLEEAKSAAFLNLKQMVNEKAEQRSIKADAWLSRKAFTVKGGIRYSNFGRGRGGLRRTTPHPLDKDN